jgi:hypothetical protein
MKLPVVLVYAWCTFFFLAQGPVLAAALPISKTEEVEWTWDVRPAHANEKLPNVLLIGDSISRNYFSEVVDELKGIANVYLLANSMCIGDPRLPRELITFSEMEGVQFQVIHFNNGMHGWEYSEAEYKSGFPTYLKTLHTIAPRAVDIWTTTTPVRRASPGGASNERIAARNLVAVQYTKNMLVDDQHALMTGHADMYQDDVHFNAAGSKIQGAEAAAMIRRALGGARAGH